MLKIRNIYAKYVRIKNFNIIEIKVFSSFRLLIDFYFSLRRLYYSTQNKKLYVQYIYVHTYIYQIFHFILSRINDR